MGSKRYSVIYADPAWEQKAGRDLSGGYKKVDGKQVFNCVSIKSENLPYQTMTVEEIANLDVKSIIDMKLTYSPASDISVHKVEFNQERPFNKELETLLHAGIDYYTKYHILYYLGD